MKECNYRSLLGPSTHQALTRRSSATDHPDNTTMEWGSSRLMNPINPSQKEGNRSMGSTLQHFDAPYPFRIKPDSLPAHTHTCRISAAPVEPNSREKKRQPPLTSTTRPHSSWGSITRYTWCPWLRILRSTTGRGTSSIGACWLCALNNFYLMLAFKFLFGSQQEARKLALESGFGRELGAYMWYNILLHKSSSNDELVAWMLVLNPFFCGKGALKPGVVGEDE